MEQRVIRFRGQAITGEWNYGHLLITDDDRAFIILPIFNLSIDQYEVKRDTIGQFTGIIDVHENPIYEGDLMEMHGNKNVIDFGVVRVIGGTWRACFEHHKFVLSMHQTKCFRLKVIGNIHENPELCPS